MLTGINLTRGAVVADGVPGLGGQDGAGSALGSVAAELLARLPDKLGEVAPGHEVGASRGVVHAVVGPRADLAVVPLVGDAGGSLLNHEVGDVAAAAPRGEVLAVAAGALVPALLLEMCLPTRSSPR